MEHLENMYDVKLKPRLLLRLTDECLPRQNDPAPSPPVVTHLLHAIKSFDLLSESCPEPSDSMLVEAWGSAVDAWVDRLLSLVSSDSMVKCWLGTSLLGVTSLECSSSRFLASYSVWLDKLLQHIEKPSSCYESVKAASYASISDMFTRLGRYSSVKREGIALGGKFIPQVLNLLSEDGSEALLEGAVGLLCTIITFFPSSIHRDYENVEAAIVSKIISGRYSVNILKKYAHGLALLPKSRGDEDSWSLMIQKLLISINVDLTDAFQCLKKGKGTSIASMCLSESSGLLSINTRCLFERSLFEVRQLLTNRVPTLMLCCCTMLTSPYPAEVTVPVGPLLAVVWRVLIGDGSLYQPLYPVIRVSQQEFTCFELAILHLCSLDLLVAIIKGAGRQLWPHAAEIVRILTAYFRKCTLANLRIKIYSAIRILMLSMGVGIALSVDQEVIKNAFIDLNYVATEKAEKSSNAYSMTFEANLQPTHKKRKHVTASGSAEELEDEAGLEIQITNNSLASPISLKIAALEALEALLTVGGALSSKYWRSSVDFLLVTEAAKAFKGTMITGEESVYHLASEPRPIMVDFKLATLRALLASLLSSTNIHCHYLLLGLELFHKGKEDPETKVSDFCAHALLALEVLMHPRQIPLACLPSASSSSFKEGLNHKISVTKMVAE